MESENLKVFKPRSSKGGLYLILAITCVMVLETILMVGLKQRGDIIIFTLMILMFAIPLVVFLVLLGWFPSMVYEMAEDRLILRCGSLKSIIDVGGIQKVSRKNLPNDFASTGFKFPGFCLFRVKYGSEGWIRMFSRSVFKDITVIETDKEKYGITPADPELFMDDLEKRIVKSHKID